MRTSDPYSRVEYRRLIAWPQRIRREWPLIEEVLALADAGFAVEAVDALRGWRRAELEATFGAAGLETERALGDFEGRPFDPEESPDLILVARRR